MYQSLGQRIAARGRLRDAGRFCAEIKEAGMLRFELPRSLLVAPLAALVVSLAPAMAFAGDSVNQSKVRISDFDLNKHDDVVRLYQYISSAAGTACGADTPTGSLLPSPKQQACVKQAIDATVTKLHRDQLTAYHQQETNPQKLADHGGLGGKNSKSDATYNDHN
ncbi:MAG: UrcA family protein [Rhodanobacteraceae bacterium]